MPPPWPSMAAPSMPEVWHSAAVWITALIEFAGGLVTGGFCVAAAVSLVRGGGMRRAQRLVADGALAGLDFKLAATLLKAAMLPSWGQIAAFAAVLALRTLLKAVFRAEQ